MKARLIGGPEHGTTFNEAQGTHLRGRPVLVNGDGVKGYVVPFYVWQELKPGEIVGIYVGTYPHHTTLEQIRALFKNSGRMMGER